MVFQEAVTHPAFIHLPGAGLAGGQWAELWEKEPGRLLGEERGEEVDGSEEESWLWCLFCRTGSALLGASAALPAPLPSPPAQPHQRQVMKQLHRSPPYLPLEALPLHF